MESRSPVAPKRWLQRLGPETCALLRRIYRLKSLSLPPSPTSRTSALSSRTEPTNLNQKILKVPKQAGLIFKRLLVDPIPKATKTEDQTYLQNRWRCAPPSANRPIHEVSNSSSLASRYGLTHSAWSHSFNQHPPRQVHPFLIFAKNIPGEDFINNISQLTGHAIGHNDVGTSFEFTEVVDNG